MGMVGMANRPQRYTRRLAESLEEFFVPYANLILARRHFQERKRVEVALQEREAELKSINLTLEQELSRRTAAHRVLFAALSAKSKNELALDKWTEGVVAALVEIGPVVGVAAIVDMHKRDEAAPKVFCCPSTGCPTDDELKEVLRIIGPVAGGAQRMARAEGVGRWSNVEFIAAEFPARRGSSLGTLVAWGPKGPDALHIDESLFELAREGLASV